MILVIGAGVIGAAVAEELVSRGAKVTVLDMRSPGRGASQASAGLLTPYIEGRGHAELLELCSRSLTMYDDFIARVRERTGLPIEYRREGTLEVAITDEELARLRDIHGWLAEERIATDLLDAAQVRAFESNVTEHAVGGLVIRGQGLVAVGALVKALVQAARLGGAEFEAPVEAVRVDPAADSIDVQADGRRLSADAVVVAAGSWSSRVRIAGQPALPVRPIRGQMVQLTWTNGAVPRCPVWGTRVYTVPWRPDTVLVGATVEDVGFDERSTASGVQELLAGASELLPAAQHAAIADIRVGLRPSTENGMPIIGPAPSESRIFLATGHFRNGVLLAPLTARMAADRLLGAA